MYNFRQVVMRIDRERINDLFPHLEGRKLETEVELAMFRSGAKLYKEKRAGDWRISGYNRDGRDTMKAIAELLDIG